MYHSWADDRQMSAWDFSVARIIIIIMYVIYYNYTLLIDTKTKSWKLRKKENGSKPSSQLW